MAQFLRPDSNVTQTSFTGGFADIDESTASDADFAYGANNTAAVLEVGLSNPSGTPASGTTTVRYRVAKTNAGTVDGSGNSVTVTAEVYQGTTLISSDTARTADGTWTAYSWTPNMASVTDWTDLRLRFTTSASGGGPSVRRGGAVSWAEMETPDAGGGGNPKVETVTTDFSTDDTATWAKFTNNGTVTVTGGVLDQTATAAGGNWSAYEFIDAHDLNDSYAYAQIVRRAIGSGGVDGAKASLRVFDSSGDGGDYVEFFVDTGGTLVARVADNGTPDADTTAAWNSTNHKWLKISKAAGGSVTFWTAPDSGSGTPGTWTSFRVASTLPSTFATAKVVFFFEYYSTAAGTITQSAQWDGFNTATTSASAVGADLSGSYGVVSAVGADRAGSYAVVAAVGQDSAGSYAVLNAAGQDQAGAYSVVSSVGQDQAGAYGIGGTVGQDSSGSYGIVAAVSADAAGSYAIHEAVGQNSGGSYGVVAAVGQDQAGAYGIAGTVGQDSAGAYAVVAAVGQDSAQTYAVIAAAGQDSSGAYAIASAVGANSAQGYGIAGTIGADSTGTYTVSETVGADQAGSYAVLHAAGQDQASTFAIVQAVGQEHAGTYGVAGSVGQDIAGSYGITATVASDSSGQYQVLASVAADGSGTYAVLEAVGADLAQVYGVLEQVASDLAGGYAVVGSPTLPVGADLAGGYAVADSAIAEAAATGYYRHNAARVMAGKVLGEGDAVMLAIGMRRRRGR